MFAVNWYSTTGPLLCCTLEKPPVPLSRVLYEQGQSQQDQDLQYEATVKGTSGLVAHRLTNLQASRNQSAQQVVQTLFCTFIAVGCSGSVGCGGSVVERQATNPVVPSSNPGQSLQYQKKFPGYCKVAG